MGKWTKVINSWREQWHHGQLLARLLVFLDEHEDTVVTPEMFDSWLEEAAIEENDAGP